MTTQKAKITNVQIGNLTIEGVMLADGTYAIAFPQVYSLFLLPQKNGARDVKALLPNDPSYLNKIQVESEQYRRGVECLTLKEFEIVLRKLDRKGNKQAQEFSDMLVGLSLHQLWSDAFGIKFEQEDRQSWLKARQVGKEYRRNLTDAIDDYMTRHEDEISSNYRKFIYTNCSNWLNKSIMKGSAKQLREKLVVPKNSLLRDYIPQAAVNELALIEEYTKRLIDEDDLEPYEATKTACIVMKAKTVRV